MAGTLFGLGLSQQVDGTGTPLAGAFLYVYEANTSTPVPTYSDFGLSVLQTFPIMADAVGRLPQIWVDDGSYRVRMTDTMGVTVFDEASVTAIGASSSEGGGGGGGGGSSVDPTAILQTGDPLWVPVTGARTGFVRANGRSIGSGSSGATERANGDTTALYELLYNTYSNTICPVSGGRGASASADFNANKNLGLLDFRSRAAVGLDDMGNSTAGIIVGGTPTAAASTGGAEKSTILQANIPNYLIPVAVNDCIGGGSQPTLDPGSGAASALNSGGSGTALTTISPYVLGTWYLKL